MALFGLDRQPMASLINDERCPTRPMLATLVFFVYTGTDSRGRLVGSSLAT